MQKTQGERPGLARVSRDGFSDQNTKREVRESRKQLKGPVSMEYQLQRTEPCSCQRVKCEAVKDHAGDKPADPFDRHQSPRYRGQP